MDREGAEEQLKATLRAARDLETAGQLRRAQGRPVRLGTPANRQLLHGRLAAALTDAGIDAGMWEAELAQARPEAARRLEEAKADTVRRSGGRAEELRQAVDGRREAHNRLAELAGSGPVQYLALERPFLIWPTHRIDLVDTTVVPWNSRARITFEQNGMEGGGLTGAGIGPAGTEELGFWFLWENTADRYAVVTINGFLILNGFCTAFSPGGYMDGTRSATVQLDANLEIFEWWKQPATTPLTQEAQTRTMLRLEVDSSGWFDDDQSEYALIYRGTGLGYDQLTVPPRSVLAIKVALSVFYHLGEGKVAVDFASGEFDVGCPFVQLAVRT
jgi:hypothetical protein